MAAPVPDTTEQPEALPILFPEETSTAVVLFTEHDVMSLFTSFANAWVMLKLDRVEPVMMTRLLFSIITGSETIEFVIVKGIANEPILIPVIAPLDRLLLPDIDEFTNVIGRYESIVDDSAILFVNVEPETLNDDPLPSPI